MKQEVEGETNGVKNCIVADHMECEVRCVGMLNKRTLWNFLEEKKLIIMISGC